MNKNLLVGSIVLVILMLCSPLLSVSAFDLSINKYADDKELVAAHKESISPLPYPFPDPEPYLTYEVTGCLYCTEGDCEDMEFFVDGHDLTYIHYSEWVYNCCATMMVQLEMEGSTIRFIELEHFSDPPCWCLCDYELTGTVHNLPSGEYIVEVWGYFYDGEYPELHCQTSILIQ